MHIDVFVSAGKFPTITVGDPGTHGAGITGVHGIGVSAPSAAAVAAATVGFARLVHIANGAMFTNGTWSMIDAAGMFDDMTREVGRIVSIEGARPKLHWMLAPLVTS